MQTREKALAVTAEVGKAVLGKPEAILKIMMAMLARGHVLIEDIPGVGKTTLAQAFARAMQLTQIRVQFTPDVLPSDIVGFSLYQKETGKFVYHPGAVACNLFLADEINRTSARTQSALLEVMEEGAVTVDGVTYPLARPFMVLATQNPVDFVGTYPLPEAQMDRFMFKLVVNNPSLEELKGIVTMTQKTMSEVANEACNAAQLLEMRETANQIPVADEVLDFAMMLISATHPDSECASEAAKKYVRLGSSPRGGQALISAAKVKALMNGRFNVSYSDIASLAYPVLRHRMKMNFEAIAERISPDEVIGMILTEVAKKCNVRLGNEVPSANRAGTNKKNK